MELLTGFVVFASYRSLDKNRGFLFYFYSFIHVKDKFRNIIFGGFLPRLVALGTNKIDVHCLIMR